MAWDERDLVQWRRRIREQVRRREDAEASIARYVALARQSGATWSEVAVCLGVSAQAVQQRYGGDR